MTKNMENLRREFEQQNLTKETSTVTVNSQNVAEIASSEKFINVTQLDFSEISNWELKNDEFEFCKSKIEKIINHTANSYLFIGKEFEEIFQKFSKSGSKDGIYEKLVEFLGFNSRTVLRCRKRYCLFELAKTISSKELVATLPMVVIEKLAKLSDEEAIKLLENSLSQKSLELNLNTLQIEHKDKKASDNLSEGYNFSEDKILDIFGGFNEKMDKLTIDKKEKVNKLIASIEKILNNNSDV